MEGSSRNSRSVPPEDSNPNNATPPPSPSTNSKTSSNQRVPGKGRFNFFSNFFRSPKPVHENGTNGVDNHDLTHLGPTSSYESVNSVTSTNSFTFVSSKKLGKGKGNKGKRIPVDESPVVTPPPPQSGEGRPTSPSDNKALPSSSKNQKVGTLRRIGMKIGLKKKYNLQSCESLEHIVSLPRVEKKSSGRKGKKASGVQPLPPKSNVEVTQEVSADTTTPSEITKCEVNTFEAPSAPDDSNLASNLTVPPVEDKLPADAGFEPSAPVASTSSSYAKVSPGSYGTWSSSTKRKRKAPPPPSGAAGGDTVSLSSGKGINYPSYPSGALRRSNSKKKVGSVNRPYSCSCSTSIFAHHSKYQRYHTQCRVHDGPGSSQDGNKKEAGIESEPSESISKVVGKKRAPVPPIALEKPVASNSTEKPCKPYNPFLEDESESSGCDEGTSSGALARVDIKPVKVKEEEPVPTSSSEPLPCSSKDLRNSDVKESENAKRMSTSEAPTSSSSSTLPLAQVNASQSTDKSRNDDTNVSKTPTVPSASTQRKSSTVNEELRECVRHITNGAVDDDEIAQNTLNDRQEQLQRNIVWMSPNPPPVVVQNNLVQSVPTSSKSQGKSLVAKRSPGSKRLSDVEPSSTSSSHTSTPTSNTEASSSSHSSAATSSTTLASLESKAYTPRPWYKRGIVSPFSKKTIPRSTSSTISPPKPSSVHLPKFSDLDREAQQIVEENKRRSAELAFTQNAKDLINIFNTAFTSSPATCTINEEPVVASSSVGGVPSSCERPSVANTTATTSVSQVPSTSAPQNTTYTPSPGQAKILSRYAPNRSAVSSSNQIPSITQVSSSPTPLVPKSTSSQVTLSSHADNTSAQSAVHTTNSTTSVTSSTGMKVSSKSGDDWNCPRCTLRNPSWRGFCGACYYRKINPLVSSTSVMLGKANNANPVPSSCSSTPSSTITSTVSQPGSSTSTSVAGTQSASSRKEEERKSSPPGENFLSQLPAKTDILKDEKLTGIKLTEGSPVDDVVLEPDAQNLRRKRLDYFAKDKKPSGNNIGMNISCSTTSEDTCTTTTTETAGPSRNVVQEEDDDGRKICNLPQLPNPQENNGNLAPDLPLKVVIPSPGEDNAPILPPKRPPKPSTSKPSPVSDDSEDNNPKFEDLLPSSSTHHQSLPSSGNLKPIFISTSNSFSTIPPRLSPSSSTPPHLRYRPNLDPISEAEHHSSSLVQKREALYENCSDMITQPQRMAHLQTFGNPSHSPVMFMRSGSPSCLLQNTNAVHPLLNANLFAENSMVANSSPYANFRPFTNPNFPPNRFPMYPNHLSEFGNPNDGASFPSFNPCIALPSNSQFGCNFTSDSEAEVDTDGNMDRRRRRQYVGGNSASDFRSSPDRQLSYEDYRRMGAVPKGYYNSGERTRRCDSPSSSSFGSRRQRSFNEDFSESSESSSRDHVSSSNRHLLKKLEWAIANGEHKLAAALAHDLAILKVNCVVAKPTNDPVNIRVYVEDRFMQQGPFHVQVFLTMTLKDLKSKIEGDWGIPAGFQKWILGKKMAEDDNVTLDSYEVTQGTMAFLYLVTPQIENVGPRKEKEVSPPPPPLPKKPSSMSPPPSTSSGRAPSSGSNNARSSNNGNTNMNQLGKTYAVPKPESVNKANSSQKRSPASNADEVPLASSLYQRPPSPRRRETNALLNQSTVVEARSSPVTVPKTPNQSATPAFREPKLPPKQTSTNEATKPIPAQNSNLNSSLHEKLSNLKQAAEALGRSIASQQQQSQSAPRSTLVASPTPLASQQIAATPPPRPPQPPPQKTAFTSTQEEEGNRNKSPKPGPSSTMMEPVPKPRLHKKAVPQQPKTSAGSSSSETEFAEGRKGNRDTSDKKSKPQGTHKKVESFCQTTLPFPPKKEDKIKIDTASSPQPTDGNTRGQNSKEGHNVIVANVIVTPFINHVMFGAGSMLQDAISSHFSSPTTNAEGRHSSMSNRVGSPLTFLDLETLLNSSSPQPKTSDEKGTSYAQMKSEHISTPERQEPPRNFPTDFKTPPVFLKKEVTRKKPAMTNVKMMAQRFNSKADPSQQSFSPRKRSEGSLPTAKREAFASSGERTGSLKELSSRTDAQPTSFLSMLQLMEKEDLIPTLEEFECPVCLVPVTAGEGVTLRDCLHNFCKDCLIGAVQYAEDPQVQCPFRDSSYSCPSALQEREIKALVPADLFEKYLAKAIKLAEGRMMNSFHCKTADCTGWCIFEDDVNLFHCPVCSKRNCITCAAIHEGENCYQYQRQMAIAAETDDDARSSRLLLEEMIERGDALECPACHVVLLKKWGCDWVRCSYCKTEICWVTRGLRWGPGGKGDISGGCKCGVNGIRCHPKCTYCH